MKVHLDHLVIAADTIQQGVDWLSEKFSVIIPAGGKHLRMGTHNCLMRIGEGIFLEIIAIDPALAAPDRPRWFGLDQRYLQESIKIQPRLLTWAVNTENLRHLLKNSDFDYGDIEPMSRGYLDWLITIRKDGTLAADGAIPVLLQWNTSEHPSNQMQYLDCELEQLKIICPYAYWLEDKLKFIGVRHLVAVHHSSDTATTRLHAKLRTPNGLVEL